MMRGLAALCLLSACPLCVQAQDFAAPAPYPVQRYEAGWGKNPFTLKTAPVALENAPFAVDLAVGTYYGDAADPTVVVVNTKTNERIRLKKSQPAANGMKLDKVQFGSSRKDIIATVTLGAETSEIRFNDNYLKQVAAVEGGRAPMAGQPPQTLPSQQQLNRQRLVPPKLPLSQPPAQPPEGTRAGIVPNAGGMRPSLAAAPGQAGTASNAIATNSAALAATTAPGTTSGQPQNVVFEREITQAHLAVPSITAGTLPATGSGNLTVSIGAPPATAAPVGTFPTQQVNAATAAELPQRRRFITPAINAATNP